MSNAVEELYSLLVPLNDDRLIVPRACVAEVVRLSRPERKPGSPEWLIGLLDWNGRSVPVVSFESMLGRDIPESGARTRVVIFYAVDSALKAGYYGILTQGFPQLVRVNRDVIKVDASVNYAESDPVVTRVKMINEYPLVPDLEVIEARLVTLQSDA